MTRARNLLHARVERFKPFRDALYDDQPQRTMAIVQAPEGWTR